MKRGYRLLWLGKRGNSGSAEGLFENPFDSRPNVTVMSERTLRETHSKSLCRLRPSMSQSTSYSHSTISANELVFKNGRKETLCKSEFTEISYCFD